MNELRSRRLNLSQLTQLVSGGVAPQTVIFLWRTPRGSSGGSVVLPTEKEGKGLELIKEPKWPGVPSQPLVALPENDTGLSWGMWLKEATGPGPRWGCPQNHSSRVTVRIGTKPTPSPALESGLFPMVTGCHDPIGGDRLSEVLEIPSETWGLGPMIIEYFLKVN